MHRPPSGGGAPVVAPLAQLRNARCTGIDAGGAKMTRARRTVSIRKVSALRLRLLIPAALAAVATYTALVRDEHATPAWSDQPESPPPAPPARAVVAREEQAAPPVDAPEPVVQEPAPAAPLVVHNEPTATVTHEAGSIFEDLAPSTLPPGTPTILDMLAGDPPSVVDHRPATTRSDADAFPAHVESGFETPLEEGRFALGGWAASAGHSVVSAVTFRKRLPTPAAADRIVLDIDAADNVPEGGLVVLSDPGFAPDRDGFTILLAAADPGPFSAAGSYRVLPSR